MGNDEDAQREKEMEDDRFILFLCPHNAAKSVAAAAYFERLAAERGVTLRHLSRH
jgi:hypothetical protein